jgi:hypothetical protein
MQKMIATVTFSFSFLSFSFLGPLGLELLGSTDLLASASQEAGVIQMSQCGDYFHVN